MVCERHTRCKVRQKNGHIPPFHPFFPVHSPFLPTIALFSPFPTLICKPCPRQPPLLQIHPPHSFPKTTAVVSENDRSGFGKRPQWFLKTTAVVFGKNGVGSFPAPRHFRMEMAQFTHLFEWFKHKNVVNPCKSVDCFCCCRAAGRACRLVWEKRSAPPFFR